PSPLRGLELVLVGIGPLRDILGQRPQPRRVLLPARLERLHQEGALGAVQMVPAGAPTQCTAPNAPPRAPNSRRLHPTHRTTLHVSPSSLPRRSSDPPSPSQGLQISPRRHRSPPGHPGATPTPTARPPPRAA